MSIKLTLSSVGNPDCGQAHDELISPPETITIESVSMAPSLCRAYIEKYDLGGGNWSGGQVHQNGKLVAEIAYNGKICAPGYSNRGTDETYKKNY